MSTAICTKCGKTVTWHARRGTRLSDLRCECGSELRRAIFNNGQWVQLQPRNRTTTCKRYQTCEVCERKVLSLRTAMVDFRLNFDSSSRVFRAGTRVCSHHCQQMLPADHPYWSLRDLPITVELLTTWIGEIQAHLSAGKPEEVTIEDWEWQMEAPAWLRSELARISGEQDLMVLRNTTLDHLLRARGVSTSYEDYRARLFGPSL